MGCSKSSSNSKVYSNTILPQETRKTLSRQPNFAPKTTGKRRTKKLKVSRRKEIIKIKAEIKEKEMKETMVKINKIKIWFFEKIKKLTNLQPDSSRKKERNQINKISNAKGEVTTDNAEIQGIKRDYYELYDNKMDKLE